MAGSLESALAEEAREVMALLEGRTLKQSTPAAQRAKSPGGMAQSPVRSMLDVAGPPMTRSGRHSSIAGTSLSGVSRPSMLDSAASTPSAVARNTLLNQRPVSRSPAPPARMTAYKPGVEDNYKFDVLPSNEANALPKRVSLGGKLGKGNSVFNRDPAASNEKRTRHGSFLSGKGKSISPGPGRSRSPGTGLNTNSMNLMPTPGKFVSDNGKLIDMNSAYRRLSDAALLKSGSNLANLPFRKELNTETGEEMAPDGGVRLTKDYTHPGDQLVDTSDEEAVSSDDEYGDGWTLEKRGRGRARKGSNEPADKGESSFRQPKSLLWAVEEERKDTAAKQQYRSLLEPEVTVTGPDGLKSEKSSKRGIHPSTSFDNHSEISTPYDTDREEVLTDIRRAQKMQVSISPIHSTPSAQRSIRQIIRGDFESFQKEAEQGLRRQRMYLVATDLSDEAAYALEWTIGTVLRDGDTLLAVYAVDEELGTGIEHSGTEPAHGADVVKDLGAITRTLSHEAHMNLTIPGTDSDIGTNGNSPISPNFPPGSRQMSTTTEHDISRMDKPEKERYFAVQEVTDRCVKLLRKTKLQVRVVVEVFHCKSPKHMITEVIDFLTPTLVILGSRGRSALKGVLLGSFSNYLVTKSSVPVMVARKKLRKHSKSGGVGFQSRMKLSNMLASATEGKFSRLETAKIEKPMALRLTQSAPGAAGGGGSGV